MISSVLTIRREAQLSTNNAGITICPRVIADFAPIAIYTNFHSPIVVTDAITNQLDISIITGCWKRWH